MGNKEKTLNFRVDHQSYLELLTISQTSGKNISEILRDVVKEYTDQNSVLLPTTRKEKLQWYELFSINDAKVAYWMHILSCFDGKLQLQSKNSDYDILGNELLSYLGKMIRIDDIARSYFMYGDAFLIYYLDSSVDNCNIFLLDPHLTFLSECDRIYFNAKRPMNILLGLFPKWSFEIQDKNLFIANDGDLDIKNKNIIMSHSNGGRIGRDKISNNYGVSFLHPYLIDLTFKHKNRTNYENSKFQLEVPTEVVKNEKDTFKEKLENFFARKIVLPWLCLKMGEQVRLNDFEVKLK